MKYTFQKIFVILLCSFFILLGLALLVPGDDGFKMGQDTFMGAAFLVMGTYVMLTGVRRINRFQKKTYLWYKATYPLNVDGNRVTCFSCGSGRINVRSLMNHTYHRDHFCTQCGTSLYFSPEGK